MVSTVVTGQPLLQSARAIVRCERPSTMVKRSPTRPCHSVLVVRTKRLHADELLIDTDRNNMHFDLDDPSGLLVEGQVE